jgi:hypothetical protein
MYRIWKVQRPLEKPRYRKAAENIDMDLKETKLEGLEWIHLAQDKKKWLGFCEHGNELPGSIK